MIYIHLKGRLGNNMFQLASAASYAQKCGVAWKAYVTDDYWCPQPDNCWLPQYVIRYKKNLFRNVEFVSDLPEYRVQISECDLRKETCPNIDVELLGRYFFCFEDEIAQQLFAIDHDTEEYIRKKYPFLFDTQQIWVSITVRRGDYLEHMTEYNLCSISYYKRSMKEMLCRYPNAHFLVISDDIDWCKKYFPKNQNIYFIDDENEVVDLYLAAKCSHNILSNSTFALWGGVINTNKDKVVILPKPWHGPALSYLDEKIYIRIPSDWIFIKNGKINYLLGWLQWKFPRMCAKISRYIRKLKQGIKLFSIFCSRVVR